MALRNVGVSLLVGALMSATSAQSPDVVVDSLNIAQVGSVDLPGEGDVVSDLYVAGDHAYVGSIEGTLFIVDISQPANMGKVAEVTTDGPALDVKVAGRLAVVGVQGGEFEGIVIIDVSDPSMPQVLSRVSQPGGVHNLFLYKERAYLAHANAPGLTVLDLRDPSMPVQTGHWDNDTGFSNVVHDVFIRDDLAFVSDIADPGGLVILDLTDLDNPVTISSVAVPEGTHSAWYEKNHVYFNQEFGGWARLLRVVDLSDPRQPAELPTFRARQSQPGQIDGPHNPWAQGDRLYWAYYDGGLRVFDISKPGRPVEIGYHTGVFSWGVQPHDDGLIYSTDMFDRRLMAFRFHEPGQMISEASVSPAGAVIGQALTVSVTAMTAVSPHGDGAGIENVSATFQDTDIPSMTLHDDGDGADAVAGDGVFAARLPLPIGLPSGTYRIRVELTDTGGLIYPFDLPFDLFPAGDLQIVDDGLTSGWVAEGSRGADMPVPVDFAGETALAVPVNSTGSFWKLDLKPPQPVNPFGYTHLRFAIHPGTLEGRAFNMVIANARVNLVDKDTGPLVDLERKEWQLVEFALSEIGVTSPIELINLTGNLSGTFYLDDMRLVAAPPPAMPTAVLEEHTDVQPTVFTLLQNYPNPFNPETTIRFDLPKAQEIELVIYNLAAQTVATLVQGHRAAGSYSVRWDGRTDAGLELASGVYVYRLTSEERVETRKLLLMK